MNIITKNMNKMNTNIDITIVTSVDMKFRPMPRAHEQAGRVRSMELEIRLASAQGWSILCTPPKTCQSI